MKNLLHNLTRDIRINLLIVFTLALGLSVNTTIFSAINSMLLEPLPFPQPERLVLIQETKLPDWPVFPVASGNFLDWQKQSTSFDAMGAFGDDRFTLVEGGVPESIFGSRTTASFFTTLEVKPAIGRLFSEEEDQPGKSDVVLLSHRLWVRRFGGNSDVLGRTINIDARPHVVIGVMPQKLDSGLDTDLWMPIAFDADARNNHGGHNLTVFGRLKKDISIDDALRELKQIASRIAAEHPAAQGWGVFLTPLTEAFVGDFKIMLLLLWGAVAFVLLIVCANITNLLFARSNSRRRDVAIRLALGASRSQVARALLFESIVLALLAGAGGVLAAQWEISGILNLASQAMGDSISGSFGITPIVLVFTGVLSIVSGILFGLLPAVELSKADLSESLKEGTRNASGGRGGQRIRNALVVAEVSLSVVLLIGSGLLIRSFIKLSQVDPGFNAANALVAQLSLPVQKYPGENEQRRFTENVLREVSTLPGVAGVSASDVPPYPGGSVYGVFFEGQPEPKPSEVPIVAHFSVSADYFRVLGIPVKRGRVFTSQDREGSPLVTVVNESFAARFFPKNENPIGKRIKITTGPDAWREIVGVVGDTRQYGLESIGPQQVYESFAQMPMPYITLVVKTAGDQPSLARLIESRVQNVDPEQPLISIRPLQRIVNESVGWRRLLMVLVSVLGATGLLIAATGVYGVLAYSVSQRTREIGVRMALGADRGRVMRLVMSQGMFRTTVGLALGLAGSVMLTWLLESMLYETSTTDYVTFAEVSAVLAGVSLLACYIPARRASKVDPMVALRHE